jgi:carbonic anhydrase
VQDIIVCGHYGCGGVQAALDNTKFGLIDNWLRNVQDVRGKHDAALAAIDATGRANRLCELNVIEQVVNVTRTTIVQAAWERQQPLAVHGWIYGVQDGILHDLQMSVSDPQHLATRYERAITMLDS